ncbi:MAG: response regulator, partial [Desulfosarcinaceae bacterium]
PILVAHRGKLGMDGSGNFTQTHCVLQDVTALRKAEEERRRLEDQLRQTQKMETIGTLAGGIAHDINNLLTIIIGNNELAMSEAGACSPLKANLEEIQLASLRARDVVRQLLTFARHNDQAQKPMHISAVVRDALKLIRSTTPANIEIQQRLPAEIDPVLGNHTQINQLIINLCGNATDAMLPAGGRLSIEIKNVTLDEAGARCHPGLQPGAHVKLVVADTGCGMNTKTLEHIFEPYYTTKKIGKGTGIGLAVVHGIVEQHNGVITVVSRPGQGTLFTVLFPAFHGQVEDKADQDIELPQGHESILFVDDEASIVKLSRFRLENLGYRVTATTDPRQALERVQADPMAFDLVVTDMAMPRMTGEILAIKLKSLRPDLPVILCTGYSETITEERAHQIGIAGFLMKPVNISDFAVAVRRTLDMVKEKKRWKGRRP